jgi:uncharacterized integral membrane protein
MTAASSSNPGGQQDPRGSASRRGALSRFAREVREGPEQGRYVALAVAAVLLLYVVGLVVANYKTVRISFVLGSAAIPLLWLIVLCVGLGVGIGWLLRGRRDRSRSARESAPKGIAR